MTAVYSFTETQKLGLLLKLTTIKFLCSNSVVVIVYPESKCKIGTYKVREGY